MKLKYFVKLACLLLQLRNLLMNKSRGVDWSVRGRQIGLNIEHSVVKTKHTTTKLNTINYDTAKNRKLSNTILEWIVRLTKLSLNDK